MEHYAVLLSTEDAFYVACEEDGSPLIVFTDSDLNPWDIFKSAPNVEVLDGLITALDPKGMKYTRHFSEVLPDYYKSKYISKLTIKIGNQAITINAVRVKSAIVRYVTNLMVIEDDDDVNDVEELVATNEPGIAGTGTEDEDGVTHEYAYDDGPEYETNDEPEDSVPNENGHE